MYICYGVIKYIQGDTFYKWPIKFEYLFCALKFIQFVFPWNIHQQSCSEVLVTHSKPLPIIVG